MAGCRVLSLENITYGRDKVPWRILDEVPDICGTAKEIVILWLVVQDREIQDRLMCWHQCIRDLALIVIIIKN